MYRNVLAATDSSATSNAVTGSRGELREVGVEIPAVR